MIDFSFAIEDRGEHDYTISRILVNPKKCEGCDDLFRVIEHEYLHKILVDIATTTEEQDHFAIEKLPFIDDWISQ